MAGHRACGYEIGWKLTFNSVINDNLCGYELENEVGFWCVCVWIRSEVDFIFVCHYVKIKGLNSRIFF